MSLVTSSNLVMFAVIFVMGFVFSLLGILELNHSLEKKRSSFIAMVSNLVATIIWFPFTLIWFTSSDLTVYFGFGYLWLALAFTFLVLSLLSVALWFRYSVQPEEKDALTIQERRM